MPKSPASSQTANPILCSLKIFNTSPNQARKIRAGSVPASAVSTVHTYALFGKFNPGFAVYFPYWPAQVSIANFGHGKISDSYLPRELYNVIVGAGNIHGSFVQYLDQ
jgi:hypothetical protein